jgi:hypothetical protein
MEVILDAKKLSTKASCNDIFCEDFWRYKSDKGEIRITFSNHAPFYALSGKVVLFPLLILLISFHMHRV